MRARSLRGALAATLALWGPLALPLHAAAHAIVLESEPARDAKLAEPPPRIYLRFKSKIEKRLTRVSISATDGRAVPLPVVADGSLGAEDEVTDHAYQSAVEHAVAGGLNVVDSAINYRRQRSERAVGSALAALHESGRVKRDGVVVATKGGFLPFDGPAPKGLLGPGDLVAGTHCMSPHYLEDQLERSLANLGLEQVDIYYVHNPETQLAELPRAAVLDRLKAAFEFLEGAARSGRIGVYGTATWTAY